jgi:hypothetical protein
MSTTLVILVVEAVVILTGVAGFLFFLSWKRSKTITVECEKLLDNVASKEDERKAQLIQFLEENYDLKTEAAEESAGYMIEAEKQFLQQFIKQQLEQTSITDFYGYLCELLDQYLYFVPTINIEQHATKGNELDQQDVVEVEVLNTDDEDFDTVSPEAKDLDEIDTEGQVTVAGDDMDEETKASLKNSNWQI